MGKKDVTGDEIAKKLFSFTMLGCAAFVVGAIILSNI